MTIQMFTWSLRRNAVRMRLMLMAVLAVAAFAQADRAKAADRDDWVATWMASPQPIWGSEFAFPTKIPATLHKPD